MPKFSAERCYRTGSAWHDVGAHCMGASARVPRFAASEKIEFFQVGKSPVYAKLSTRNLNRWAYEHPATVFRCAQPARHRCIVRIKYALAMLCAGYYVSSLYGSADTAANVCVSALIRFGGIANCFVMCSESDTDNIPRRISFVWMRMYGERK